MGGQKRTPLTFKMYQNEIFRKDSSDRNWDENYPSISKYKKIEFF